MKLKNIITIIKDICLINRYIRRCNKRNFVTCIRTTCEIDEVLLRHLLDLNKGDSNAMRVFILLVSSKKKHDIYNGEVNCVKIIKEHSFIEPMMQKFNFLSPATADTKIRCRELIKNRISVYPILTKDFKNAYLHGLKEKFGIVDTLYVPICFFHHKTLVILSIGLRKNHSEMDIRKSEQIHLELELLLSKCKGFTKWRKL